VNLPKHINLTIEHNPHKAVYQNVEQWLVAECHDDPDKVNPDDRAAMLATDEVWVIQWYPDTPIGFHIVYAATLPRALERALEVGAPSEITDDEIEELAAEWQANGQPTLAEVARVALESGDGARQERARQRCADILAERRTVASLADTFGAARELGEALSFAEVVVRELPIDEEMDQLAGHALMQSAAGSPRKLSAK